jgi:mRNA interferase YafQ
MLIPQDTTRFRRDLRRMKRRGKDGHTLQAVVRLRGQEQPLTERHHDHPLVGDRSSYRDCHIEPDWLLLDKSDRDEETLTLVRTGTQADLFET